MINDEVSSKAMNLEIRMAKLSVRELIKALKTIEHEGEKEHLKFQQYIEKRSQTGAVKLKTLAKRGQLENITVPSEELRALKKQLNRYGVGFSVMKDKESGMYSLFFQSKDAKTLDFALKKSLKKLEKKQTRRASVRKSLNKFKEKVRDTASKDKEKHMHHEQER